MGRAGGGKETVMGCIRELRRRLEHTLHAVVGHDAAWSAAASTSQGGVVVRGEHITVTVVDRRRLRVGRQRRLWTLFDELYAPLAPFERQRPVQVVDFVHGLGEAWQVSFDLAGTRCMNCGCSPGGCPVCRPGKFGRMPATATA